MNISKFSKAIFCRNAVLWHINALISSSFNSCTMNYNHCHFFFNYLKLHMFMYIICYLLWFTGLWTTIKILKNSKYLKSYFFFVTVLCLVIKGGRGVDGRLYLIIGHISTNNYRRTKNGSYFAFSSLTLQALQVLYFSDM